MNLKDLTKTMDYKMRVWPWGMQLAYIDARQAQDLLDEVCWPENWKVEYRDIMNGLFAWVSIKVWEEWITKWDWGTESQIEKEKGLISDSFKRACVCWGIWRFLYSLKPTKSTSTTTQSTSPQEVYTMTQKDVDNWQGKIYGKSVYINWEKKNISNEQITKLKAHEKYVELPPKN